MPDKNIFAVSLVFVLIFGFILFATTQKSYSQGASNCCSAQEGTGCDDQTCEDTVCAIDPFCCNVQWDFICAGEATDLCEVCGSVSDEGCCTGLGEPDVCSILTAEECSNEGGTYQGDGTVCEDFDECLPQGCCTGLGPFPDACDILTERECVEEGGTYQGDGTMCEQYNQCFTRPIPTFTQWGMIGTAGFLGLISLVYLLTRRRELS